MFFVVCTGKWRLQLHEPQHILAAKFKNSNNKKQKQYISSLPLHFKYSEVYSGVFTRSCSKD